MSSNNLCLVIGKGLALPNLLWGAPYIQATMSKGPRFANQIKSNLLRISEEGYGDRCPLQIGLS